MRPQRGIVGAALALALAVVLAGCNGESERATPPPDDATPSQSESSSPSPSPTPSTEKVPAPPKTASKRTDKAAIDFAAYFVQVLNYTAESGDTGELASITGQSCTSCRNIQRATERVYSADGYVRGGSWSIDSQSVFRPDPGKASRIVTFEVRTSPQTYRPSSAKPEQRFDSANHSIDVYLRPDDGSWLITRMDKTS